MVFSTARLTFILWHSIIVWIVQLLHRSSCFRNAATVVTQEGGGENRFEWTSSSFLTSPWNTSSMPHKIIPSPFFIIEYLIYSSPWNTYHYSLPNSTSSSLVRNIKGTVPQNNLILESGHNGCIYFWIKGLQIYIFFLLKLFLVLVVLFVCWSLKLRLYDLAGQSLHCSIFLRGIVCIAP